MFRSLGWQELVIVLVIVLIIFGVGRLPQVGGAIGKGIRAFRKGQSGEDDVEDKSKSKTTTSENTEKKG
ncbi:MAG: twin-arginine translocase TatA/TatE family subunit [Chloroflexota bacterium]